MNDTRIRQQDIIPEVDMAATVSIVSDCYPYTVISVSPSKNQIVVQADRYDAAHTIRHEGDPQDFLFYKDDQGGTMTFTRRRDGRFWVKGCPMGTGYGLSLGHRRYYRDPHR